MDVREFITVFKDLMIDSTDQVFPEKIKIETPRFNVFDSCHVLILNQIIVTRDKVRFDSNGQKRFSLIQRTKVSFTNQIK
jgi:hypothetical protein